MSILNYISKFKGSKKYNDMVIGERYFMSRNDILNRKFYHYVNGVRELDPYRANNIIVDNFFRMLIEQKVSYCLSKDVVIQNYIPTINVNDFIDEIAEESSIKGIGWAQLYINNINALKVAIIPSQEVIPFFDDTVEKNLLEVIRFYDSCSGIEKVEHWTSTNVTYYQVDKEKGLIVEKSIGHDWGRVPFVPLYNNRYEISDLDNIKPLIDSYDKVISDFSNNFEDFQEVFYKVKNYAGTTQKMEDIANLIEFIKQYRMIPVDADGDFNVIQLEVPHVARETYLSHVRKLIFLFGLGVDSDELSGGSLTNVAIKSKSSNLEQKGNKFLKFVRRFIEELMYFDIKYKEQTGNPETDLSNFKIVFNTTTLINESEMIRSEYDKIKGVKESEGLISKETNISEHPWVSDVNEEFKRIEKENSQEPQEPQEPQDSNDPVESN